MFFRLKTHTDNTHTHTQITTNSCRTALCLMVPAQYIAISCMEMSLRYHFLPNVKKEMETQFKHVFNPPQLWFQVWFCVICLFFFVCFCVVKFVAM